MFAIIKTGGKQYKVAKDSIIKIEKIEGDLGAKVEFQDVLMIGEKAKPVILGSPIVSGAKVKAEIVNQALDNKVIVFKKKRRQNYRRTKGHRQEITQVKILDIQKTA